MICSALTITILRLLCTLGIYALAVLVNNGCLVMRCTHEHKQKFPAKPLNTLDESAEFPASVSTESTQSHEIGLSLLQFRGPVFLLKGSGHYWRLLKIIISIKPYLVTSNGERLIV